MQHFNKNYLILLSFDPNAIVAGSCHPGCISSQAIPSALQSVLMKQGFEQLYQEQAMR